MCGRRCGEGVVGGAGGVPGPGSRVEVGVGVDSLALPPVSAVCGVLHVVLRLATGVAVSAGDGTLLRQA